MPDDSPLDKLQGAIQEFINAEADESILLDNALVLWEQVTFDAGGATKRNIMYCVPTDNFTLSGTLGLLEAGGVFVRRDILGLPGEDIEG